MAPAITATTPSIANACVIESADTVIEDVRRAQEFYRYLQPDNLLSPNFRRRSSTFDQNHDHVPSLSHALAPFCQLAALRCNAYKAMLNVMDRDVMYFLAEASLRKDKPQAEDGYEFIEDPILMSCSSVPLKGRICELTVRMEAPEDTTRVPTFVIPDLSKSQFAEMGIVAGPPYYRFYAGVPIATRSGVSIGSIAIMDTVARPNGLTHEEEEFLGKAADQIMSYLETNRQAIEGRRSRQMAQGLEAFISGKKSILEDGANLLSQRTLRKRAKAAYGIALESDNDKNLDQDRSPKTYHHLRMDARSDSIISADSESNSAQSIGSEENRKEEADNDSRSHSRTFARAANLLRESLGDLGEDGSVHFLNLATRLSTKNQQALCSNGHPANLPRVDSLTDFTNGGKHEQKQTKNLQCRVVASSTTVEPIMTEHDESAYQSLELDDEFLRSLMRKYPGGRLWTLEEFASSSSEDDLLGVSNASKQKHGANKSRRSSRRKRSELMALRAAFPNARQVLFVPVWDAIAGSFAYGCFITSALETRSFTASTELPFLNSFCSTIMAECSRLDAMLADRQKSDFVGTISHEMRSPLHGVLASVEFLADTDLDGFQKSLIETIDSCGRTLLDTINHVLDFSKVNSFQKQWQAANKRGTPGARRTNFLGPDNSSRAVAIGAPPLLQLFGATDISAVLEEVIDGLVLGQTYISGIDITDTSREARGRVGVSSNPLDTPRSVTKPSVVDIVLNVQHADWTFMTQPGAIRRIIMNVTGNALKYTTQGSIQISLQQREAPDDVSNTRVMVLTVTDTGKGISSEFLESRLFVPFAQENALAPGTGLGMSIVRSIVLMLGGTIDVRSKVGRGTTVEVSIPMKRPLPGQVSTHNTPRSGGTGTSANSSEDESIQLLQNQAHGETVTLYRPQQRGNEFLEKAMRHYVNDWFNLEYVDQRLLEKASVVILEEEDLESLMHRVTSTLDMRASLIVICSVESRHNNTIIKSLEQRLVNPVEFVARPCGPNKLARSIRQVLEKKRTIKPRFPQVATLGVIQEALTPGSNLTPLTAYDPAGNELQQLDLSHPGELGQVVQASETFAASQISQNAQMAIRDPSADLRTPRPQQTSCDEFPFPTQSETSPEQRQSKDEEIPPSSGPSSAFTPSLAKQLNGEADRRSSTNIDDHEIDPRVLLVDDNKINLKLLETFLKRKRKYTRIEQAEDGQQAVNAYTAAKEQYDIVFMDISMPVMNGFEATREIRAYEERCSVMNGAMIIALTGLASGRDQSEGFDSGCDIYMTKPVSFKEVGKLLDNWEGHRRINMAENEVNGKMAALKIQPHTNGIGVESGDKSVP